MITSDKTHLLVRVHRINPHARWRRACDYLEVEKLLAALEARDAEAATDVMRAHYRELDLDFANVIFGPAPAS